MDMATIDEPLSGLLATVPEDVPENVARNTERVVTAVYAGLPFAKACEHLALRPATVRAWLRKWPELFDAVDQADQDRVDALLDDTIAIADDDSGDVARDRLRIEARQTLAKLRIRRYRTNTTEHTGAKGTALGGINVVFVEAGGRAGDDARLVSDPRGSAVKSVDPSP